MAADEREIEALARKMCKADGHDPDESIGWLDDSLAWELYAGKARAAIRASITTDEG